MAKISIIVTSFNIDGYIGQCLTSVVNQTLKDLEIIVVDDGSTDGTPGVIADFAARDERITPVLLKENSVGGVATAANAGLELATAPYVGFVDGDDYCEPTMFEDLLNAIVRCDADLAMCRYRLIDDEGRQSDPADHFRWADLDDSVYALDVDERRRFLQFVAVPWRKVYRRSMLEGQKIRFPVGDYFYEDNPFHWFCLLSADSIAVVPEVLCYHRIARQGQTMATVDDRLLRMFTHHDTIRQWLAQRGIEADYSSALLTWTFSQLEWISSRCPASLRRELFDRVQPIIAGYDRWTVDRALIEGRKGDRARALVAALSHNNYAGFAKVLDLGAEPSSPWESARYYLHNSDLKTTTRYASRYLVNVYARVRQSLSRRRVLDPVRNKDLMFALVHLDQRLQQIDRRLSEQELLAQEWRAATTEAALRAGAPAGHRPTSDETASQRPGADLNSATTPPIGPSATI